MYKNKKTREKVENRRFPAFFLRQGTLVRQDIDFANCQKIQKIRSEFVKIW